MVTIVVKYNIISYPLPNHIFENNVNRWDIAQVKLSLNGKLLS